MRLLETEELSQTGEGLSLQLKGNGCVFVCNEYIGTGSLVSERKEAV